MKKMFKCANQYVKDSDWKDLALLKICLCSLGVMIGLSIPKEKRKYPLLVAGIVFAATCFPLMVKYIKIVVKASRPE